MTAEENALQDDTDLFRIMRFDHLVQMFERNMLRFSHPSSWDDPYERIVDHPAMNCVFVQCWSRIGESDAMWRIYSPDNHSVMIQTKAGQLKEGLAYLKNDGYRKNVHRVSYVEEDELVSRLEKIKTLMGGEDKPTYALSGLFFKRKPFAHESEIRAVVYDEKGARGSRDAGLKIQIDPHALFNRVVIDPRASDQISDAYRHYITNVLGFAGQVEKSRLYHEPKPFSFG